jgi:hypothetical protein
LQTELLRLVEAFCDAGGDPVATMEQVGSAISDIQATGSQNMTVEDIDEIYACFDLVLGDIAAVDPHHQREYAAVASEGLSRIEGNVDVSEGLLLEFLDKYNIDFYIVNDDVLSSIVFVMENSVRQLVLSGEDVEDDIFRAWTLIEMLWSTRTDALFAFQHIIEVLFFDDRRP